MSNPKLDRTRHFGSIHPPYNGAAFEQGGNYFGGDGRFLFRQGEVQQAAAPAAVSAPAAETTQPEPAPAAPPAPPAPPPAPEAPEAIEASPEPAPEPVSEAPDSDGGEPSEPVGKADLIVNEVNLTKWAKGEEKFPFFAVKKAANDFQADINASNTKTILAGLIEYGVITAEEAKQ